MNLLSNLNPLIITVTILALAVVGLLFWIINIHFKMKKFLINIDSKNISDSLLHVSNNLKDLQRSKTDIEKYLIEVEKRLNKSIQSVHTVRFNPFHGSGEGGNQSFATAFLNENGDGAVISSLYSRDRVSVFSKPIKNFTSEHEMSDEEKEALEKAKSKLKNNQ